MVRKRYVFVGITTLLLIGSALVFIVMPRGKKFRPAESAVIAALVRDGDIICRLGDRFWSDVFSDLSSTDKRYSHVGIVRVHDGIVTIINAEGGTGDGRDFVNESGLDEFLSVARTAGVYRIKDMDGARIAALAVEYVGVPFDWEFDMSDSVKLYCTELPYVVLKRLLPDLRLATSYIKVLKREIILPEAISRSGRFSEVYFVDNR